MIGRLTITAYRTTRVVPSHHSHHKGDKTMKILFFLIGGGFIYAILSGAAVFAAVPAGLVWGFSALAGLLIASVI